MSLVRDVPLERLRTSLASLRGPRTDRSATLAPLPLRVAQAPDGAYEVLDGFKRLAAWRDQGHTQVPVVVEDAPGVTRKARLLEANAPRRTLSPMDEARVVASLAEADRLTPFQIAKLLGHGRGWVARRLTLGRRLAAELGPHVDDGRLSSATAGLLAALPRGEQPRLAEVIERHGLRTREADAFLATWRACSDETTREALRRDPRGAGPRPAPAAPSPLGPSARALETRFEDTEGAVAELIAPDLTGFPETERRVLEARQRRLRALVLALARAPVEVPHADSRGTGRTAPSGARARAAPGHRPPAGPGREDHPPGAGSVPPLPQAPAPASTSLEAGTLPRADPRAVRAGPALPAHPARAPGAGLLGRPDHPEGLPALARTAPERAPEGLPPLRDAPRGGSPIGLEPLPRDDRRGGDGGPRLLPDPGPLAAGLRGLLPR